MLPVDCFPFFPLPNVVLFPNVFLPLHIFEPRYRQMVNDALSGDRMIGMVLLKPGYEAEYERCAGDLRRRLRRRSSRTSSGCPTAASTSSCAALERFRIDERGAAQRRVLYRERASRRSTRVPARVRWRHAACTRGRLETLLAPLFTAARAASPLPEIMPDDDLVNALAQYLELEPVEKQALLEMAGPLERAPCAGRAARDEDPGRARTG